MLRAARGLLAVGSGRYETRVCRAAGARTRRGGRRLEPEGGPVAFVVRELLGSEALGADCASRGDPVWCSEVVRVGGRTLAAADAGAGERSRDGLLAADAERADVAARAEHRVALVGCSAEAAAGEQLGGQVSLHTRRIGADGGREAARSGWRPELLLRA